MIEILAFDSDESDVLTSMVCNILTHQSRSAIIRLGINDDDFRRRQALANQFIEQHGNLATRVQRRKNNRNRLRKFVHNITISFSKIFRYSIFFEVWQDFFRVIGLRYRIHIFARILRHWDNSR